VVVVITLVVVLAGRVAIDLDVIANVVFEIMSKRLTMNI
jgi:hypothetical protein